MKLHKPFRQTELDLQPKLLKIVTGADSLCGPVLPAEKGPPKHLDSWEEKQLELFILFWTFPALPGSSINILCPLPSGGIACPLRYMDTATREPSKGQLTPTLGTGTHLVHHFYREPQFSDFQSTQMASSVITSRFVLVSGWQFKLLVHLTESLGMGCRNILFFGRQTENLLLNLPPRRGSCFLPLQSEM